MIFVGRKQTGCAFCDVLRSSEDEKYHLVWRGEQAFVMLNLYPYNTGHLLVIANAHLASLEDLEPACRAEMMELAARSMAVLRQVYHPHGFNVGANIGEAAGAGIPGHIHLHILPRWTGDASFVTTLAEMKVMPETLEETYRRVREAWRSSG
jgi:ATP adenylyltransferase